MKEYIFDPITLSLIPVDKKASLGVYGDNQTSGAVITVPNSMLSVFDSCNFFINFTTDATEEIYIKKLEESDIERKEDTTVLTWHMDRRATETVGMIVFNLCIKDDSVEDKELNSSVTKDVIKEGLEGQMTPEEEEKSYSLYEELATRLRKLFADLEEQIPSDYTELSDKVDSLGTLDSVVLTAALKSIYG